MTNRKFHQLIASGSATLAAGFLNAQTGPAAAQTPGAEQKPPETHALYAYVGSFTTAERKARGDGIHVYRVDPDTSAWTHVQHIGDLVNPSYLALSPDQRFLYSVHGDEDYATAFALDAATGQAKLLNRAKTGGKNGVREAVDPSGKFLVVANYASGSVAVLPIAPDGSLKDQQQVVQLPGEPGPHKVEQTSSHPHDIVFDHSGRFVLVPDKGLDRVFVFRFDAATGRLDPTEQGSVKTRPGAGPRHLAFHPVRPVAWVVNELDSTIATYSFDTESGALKPVQVMSTLPPEFTGYSTAAEIAVSPRGPLVYASNRGHDGIAWYKVLPQDGALRIFGWQSTLGKTPRFIGVDPAGRYLYAANEQSDTVVTLRIDQNTGIPVPNGNIIQNASPVTIVFAGGK
jgi:6-phosphogluconolactonase